MTLVPGGTTERTNSVQTVDKALGLLDYFSEQRSSIGLSEFARLAGYNKATTRRFLVAPVQM